MLQLRLRPAWSFADAACCFPVPNNTSTTTALAYAGMSIWPVRRAAQRHGLHGPAPLKPEVLALPHSPQRHVSVGCPLVRRAALWTALLSLPEARWCPPCDPGAAARLGVTLAAALGSVPHALGESAATGA